MTFSGYLTRQDTGAGVVGVTISIYDSDPLTSDDFMASGTTTSNGYFSITWTARPMDPGDRGVEAYAKFGGTSVLGGSQSTVYSLAVSEKVGTSLTLSVSTNTPAEGDEMTFSGYLTRQDTGAGVVGVTISIYDSDPLTSDDFMASGTTTSNGYFSITWTARPMDPGDRGVEAYAKFEGTSVLGGSQSTVITVTTAAPAFTHISTPVPSDLWRENIRSGDLVLDPTGASLLGILTFGHVGICYETDETYYVVEAVGTGVNKTPIEEWDKKAGVYVLRVDCSDQVAAAAASLALTQVSKVYQPWYLYLDKSSDMSSSMWYCSELVWAAYYNLGIDIEYTPDIFAISPWEVYKTTQVIYHYGPDIVAPSQQVPRWLYWINQDWAEGAALVLHILAECPVDLVVTDPDGLTISRSSSEIPDAIYMIDDFNDDGSPDTLVGIANSKIGTYDIAVVPQTEAQLTDTYTLITSQRAGTTVVADNVTVEDIPGDAYAVEYIDEVVSFPDSNLETAIRDAVNKPSGDIHQSDLDALTSLNASSRDIIDLTGVERCTSLQSLWLYDNQISDIKPLVDNVGLSQGKSVYLSFNPLSNDSVTIYIPTLVGRGVNVYYETPIVEDTSDSIGWVWIGIGIFLFMVLGGVIVWIRYRWYGKRGKRKLSGAK